MGAPTGFITGHSSLKRKLQKADAPRRGWVLYLSRAIWTAEKQSSGYQVPVPLTRTVCWLPPPLSDTATVPFDTPVLGGVKVTAMVQAEPPPRLVPQLLV